MSRRQRRRRGRRMCHICRKVYMTRPALEDHLRIHLLAEDANQDFETTAQALADLRAQGLIRRGRGGTLAVNADRAADLFGKEAS
jgi:CRP-like cAMP-binding protein